MIQNLNIRWIIIISIIITGIYFIMPSYELYTIKNDPELTDIDTSYLTEDAIQLGLDLKGGLYIILELDYATYLLNQANTKLTAKTISSTLIVSSIFTSPFSRGIPPTALNEKYPAIGNVSNLPVKSMA